MLGTEKKRCRLAVFASGSGSNLQALLDYERAHSDWPAEIVLVVSDKPACTALERARAAGVPTFAVDVKTYPDKAAYEQAVLTALQKSRVDWLVLAGYMRLIGPTLLHAYPERILNIHPSLLPAFPGRTAVRDTLAAGVAVTGVTVHLVDEGMDTGPIVAQQSVPVDSGMTEAELLERIHAVEHVLYPATVTDVVNRWLSGRPMLARMEPAADKI
ncbi:phosphoribosylglycinamide formyltransferase [Alicyclobacillus contaminans]|uniref:phosphoribosylglycinamide formyltransferase n=1 Tax=Alicyclobacillus contaminans TaxID=392016 RepID=UPI0004042F1D|nr:phosphoribosylglycinamide formyltransferase [Alicyclobacillus contaminans]GMA50307.1 phosphoribosylglycinamide formyltransferase [Alicyclobacillus contaminans]